MQVSDKSQLGAAVEALGGLGTLEKTDAESGRIRIAVGEDFSSTLVEAVRRLDGAAVKVGDLAMHRPTLDDVFLNLTGHAAEGAGEGQEAVAGGRRGRKTR